MGRWKLLASTWSLLLVCVSGCAAGDHGTDAIPCDTDLDCDRRSVCDVARRECVPAGDAGAPDGGSGDGGAGEGGLCAECEGNHDCLALGAECRETPAGDRRCTRLCDEDAPCPGGYDCTADGHCVPTNGDCTCLPEHDGAFRPCVVENEAGSCEGIQSCDGAAGWLFCQAPDPAPEVCDGQDNDCDGERDEPEDLGLGTCGQGVCEAAEQCLETPDGASIECTPGAPALPRDTECNRLDDDCDGKVDEDFDAFTCGLGVCEVTATCTDGVVECVAGVAQMQFDTTCNAIDEDCSGADDEDYVGPTCGLGICVRTGTCVDGLETCTPGQPAPDDDPELLFEDANCDGIDGDAALAIFVDLLTGDDGNPGTMDEPMQTIQAAIDTAWVEGKDVYVSEGVYAESIVLAEGVGLYGGYSAADGWSRSQGNRTEISGGTTAATGDGIDDPTELQLLTLRSADNLAAGGSSYGLFLTDSTGVLLTRVTIRAGDGGNGTDGTDGTDGADGTDGDPGNPGCEDEGGWFCTNCDTPGGGAGGTSACTRTGGTGGTPGYNCDCGTTGGTGAGGTLGGAPGCGCGGGDGAVGDDGAPGDDGTDGAAGASFGTSGAGGYTPSAGAHGSDGTDGDGGGGGGGGSGGNDDCDSYGSSGGGGGAGGCNGTRGTRGTGGGGSFAIFLRASSIVLADTDLFTGIGGTGGDGGTGGAYGEPGGPGAGGPYGGGSEQDDGGYGNRGGWGGRGGRGGHGGGGGGGPSIGVECSGGSDAVLDVDTDVTTGAGGAGGASLGNDGPTGLEADTHGC